MRITFNMLSSGLTYANDAATAMVDAEQQLSSGKRIQAPSDDPAAAERAVGDHANLDAIDSYTAVGNSAAARLSTADNTLTDMINQLTQALSTATSAQSTTQTPTSLNAVAQQLLSIRDSIAADVNTTFQGTSLFAGSQVNSQAYANTGTGWQYQGDSAPAQVAVDTGRSVALSFDGQALLQGGSSTDILTSLENLATAVQSGDETGIASGISDINAALDRANQTQGRVGADENTVTDSQARLTTLQTATDAQRSQDEDTNMADAASRLTQAQTAYQAALMAVSTSEKLSLLNYLQ